MKDEPELYRLEKEYNRPGSFVLTVCSRGGVVQQLHLSKADLVKLCEGVLGELRDQHPLT